jgi:hypothetical protein
VSRFACIAAATLALLAGCGDAQEQAAQPEALTLAAFEKSAFVRKHPAKDKSVQALQPAGQATLYSFDDTETDGRIVVQFEPSPERIGTITITWPSEGAGFPAPWDSIKKQFLADLLESTFSDVDYGQVSAHVLGRVEGSMVADPGLALDKARLRAGHSGDDLVVEISR